MMNDTKTYTVELTELEAAAVTLLSGFISGNQADGTFRHAYESVDSKLKSVGVPDYRQTPWYSGFKEENGSLNIKGGFKSASLIQLNSDYTAEVTPEGIKVGCQTFPLSVIDLLVAARNKITPTAKE